MNSIPTTTCRNIKQLPHEVLTDMCLFLGPRSVTSFGTTCNDLEIVSQHPYIWRHLYHHMATQMNLHHIAYLGGSRKLLNRLYKAQQSSSGFHSQNWNRRYQLDIHKTLKQSKYHNRWWLHQRIYAQVVAHIQLLNSLITCPSFLLTLCSIPITYVSGIFFFGALHMLIASYGLATPIMLPIMLCSFPVFATSSLFLLSCGCWTTISYLSGFFWGHYLGEKAIEIHQYLLGHKYIEPS